MYPRYGHCQKNVTLKEVEPARFPLDATATSMARVAKLARIKPAYFMTTDHMRPVLL